MSVAARAAFLPSYSRIPSLGYRILAGTARLVLLLIALVGVPAAALAYLDSLGISLPVPIPTVVGAWVAIAVLSTARAIARPTRAYGPLSVATSAVTIAYLLVLRLASPYRLAAPSHSLAISVGYATFLDLVLLVPALLLVAGIVTTVEDVRFPGERLPYDYPA